MFALCQFFDEMPLQIEPMTTIAHQQARILLPRARIQQGANFLCRLLDFDLPCLRVNIRDHIWSLYAHRARNRFA